MCIRDRIKLGLEKRFGSVEINDVHTIATYLDPRYKGKFFCNAILEQVTSSLCVAVEKLQSDQFINSPPIKRKKVKFTEPTPPRSCLLYTSDAADERSSVDLGGRRIIKKKR